MPAAGRAPEALDAPESPASGWVKRAAETPASPHSSPETHSVTQRSRALPRGDSSLHICWCFSFLPGALGVTARRRAYPEHWSVPPLTDPCNSPRRVRAKPTVDGDTEVREGGPGCESGAASSNPSPLGLHSTAPGLSGARGGMGTHAGSREPTPGLRNPRKVCARDRASRAVSLVPHPVSRHGLLDLCSAGGTARSLRAPQAG